MKLGLVMVSIICGFVGGVAGTRLMQPPVVDGSSKNSNCRCQGTIKVTSITAQELSLVNGQGIEVASLSGEFGPTLTINVPGGGNYTTIGPGYVKMHTSADASGKSSVQDSVLGSGEAEFNSLFSIGQRGPAFSNQVSINASGWPSVKITSLVGNTLKIADLTSDGQIHVSSAAPH